MEMKFKPRKVHSRVSALTIPFLFIKLNLLNVYSVPGTVLNLKCIMSFNPHNHTIILTL